MGGTDEDGLLEDEDDFYSKDNVVVMISDSLMTGIYPYLVLFFIKRHGNSHL